MKQPEKKNEEGVSSLFRFFRQCTSVPVYLPRLLPPEYMNPQIHFTCRAADLAALDHKIRSMGFASRAAYLTACISATLYGRDAGGKLDSAAAGWIEDMTGTAADLTAVLADVVREIAHPVIAVKGADIAFDRTCDIIQNAVLERSGIWPTDTEVFDAVRRYELEHMPELLRYRNAVLAEKRVSA